MKLRILLITGILAFFGLTANAQCSASAMYYQSGATTTFIDSSYSVNGHDVYWSFGDGTTGSGSWTSHAYTANGTYNACLYIYDTAAPCADTFCFNVTISSVGTCIGSFTYSVDSSNPFKLNFNNTSTNADSALWWFGGSTYSSTYNPSFTFSTAGYQTVCLTTYDSSGNFCDSICNTVYVPGTTASCAADANFYIVDSTVYFMDSSYAANGYYREWSFGDGGTSTAFNPSNTYATNQYYTACLYIEDTITGCSDTTCWSIYIPGSTTSSCNASFYSSIDSTNPYKVNFSNYSTNAASVSWLFSDPVTMATSTQYSPSFTFAISGYKTVCLTTYDSSGNVCDSLCKSVYVYGASTSSCDAYFWPTVSGNTVTFYDSLTSGNIFEYGFGDGTYGYGSTPSKTYSSSGTYTACLFVYDVDSVGDTLLCDSFCQTFTVGGSTSCDASFSFNVDSINMSASSFPVNFYSNTSGQNYIWNFGDGTTDTSASPTHTYTSSGTYTACLTIISGYDSLSLPIVCDTFCTTVTVGTPSGCSPTMSYVVDSINSNRFYFSGSNPPAGGYVLWEIYEPTGNSYYSSQTVTHTFSGSGWISVYYNVYRADSTICGYTGDTLNLTGSCQASYYLAVDTSNLYNLYIVNNSTGTTSATNYYWTFGDGSSSTAQYPTHQYASFGLYNLCLTISDSASGCSSTHCDSIGLDSNGNLLKKGAFGITVVDESDLLGTPKVETIQGVSVYPNPTVGRFTIKLNALQAEDLEITVMSSLGQVLSTSTQRVNAGGNALQMDLSNNPTGIYFVTMRAGNQVKNIRLNIISK